MAVVKFRNPWPPHEEWAEIAVGDLSYGFVLNDVGRASFTIPVSDPQLALHPQYFSLGAMVSIERADGLLPWVGYVVSERVAVGEAAAAFECRDIAGAVFARARTAKSAPVLRVTAGEAIRQVFAETNSRAEPPLIAQLSESVSGGPIVDFQPKAETFLSFLQTMAETGWEWGLVNRVSPAVSVELVWQERLGFDRRSEVTFERGVHFHQVERVRDVEGFIESALVVGGTGQFAARPAVQVNPAGRSDVGVDGARSGFPPATSPALAGTRVLVEPSLRDRDALFAAGRRQFHAPEFVGERLTISLVESTIDMKRLELGSWYTVRLGTLLGMQYERAVRCVGLTLGQEGIVELIAEVARG